MSSSPPRLSTIPPSWNPDSSQFPRPKRAASHVETTIVVRSKSQRRRKLSTTIENVAERIDNILTLRKAILKLCVLILKQSTSPFQCAKILNNKLVSRESSPVPIKEATTTGTNDTSGPKLEEEPSGNIDTTSTVSFLSMTWPQQRYILEDGLRPFFQWSSEFQDSQLKIILSGSKLLIDPFQESLCRIGESLTDGLLDDSDDRDSDEPPIYESLLKVSRDVKRLSNEFKRHLNMKTDGQDDTLLERTRSDHTGGSSDLVDKLQERIGSLYRLLNPFKKDSCLLQSQVVVPEFPPSSSIRSQSANRRRRFTGSFCEETNDSESLNRNAPEKLTKGQRVHFASPYEGHEDNRRHKRSKWLSHSTEVKVTASKEHDNVLFIQKLWDHRSKLSQAPDLEMHSGKRVVLRVFSKTDAFQSLHTNSLDMDQEIQNEVRESKVTSTISLSHEKSDSKLPSIADSIDILSEGIANLHLQDNISSVDVVKRFLLLLPDCQNTSEYSEHAEIMKPLNELALILALLMSLPEWMVYATASNTLFAKTALFLVYCCFLEEAAKSSTDCYKRILAAPKMDRDDTTRNGLARAITFFYICIQKLSEFEADNVTLSEQKMLCPDQFQSLRVPFLTLKKVLDDETQKGSSVPMEELYADKVKGNDLLSKDEKTNCMESNHGKSDNLKIPNLQPFFLVCYLSSGTESKSTSSETAGNTGLSEPVSVRRLFTQSTDEQSPEVKTAK